MEVRKREEETTIRMEGALELAAAEVESNYLTCLSVTMHPIPCATIRILFPRLHLWKRSITKRRTRTPKIIDGKGSFKLQKRRVLFLSAELGMQKSDLEKEKEEEEVKEVIVGPPKFSRAHLSF